MKKNVLNILYFAVIFTLIFSVMTIQGQNQADSNVETTNETEYWALLVAVAEYADDPNQNRPLMLDEVDGFHEILLTSPNWEDDHIKIIKTEDATPINILQGLRWLDEKEDENDMSVFYITTHGFPLDYDFPPFDEADKTDEAIASYWLFAYPTMFISDDEINFMLNRLESRGVCMIVDTCYAGGFNDSPDWNRQNKDISNTAKSDVYISEWMNEFGTEISGQGRIVLMASREDEVSYSGGFAPYLLDAMKGYGDANDDGVISVEEMFYYAEPRAVQQHPTIFDNYPGEFPLITISPDQKTETDYVYTQNKSTVLTESSNYQRVCGYIKDSEQDKLIENATVQIISGDYWSGQWNRTITDVNGYYSFDVQPGEKRIFAEKIGYLRTMLDSFTVSENETVWKNITLDPHPPENAVVCGFLTDSESGQIIADARVIIEWGHHFEGYQNFTRTDNTGFYIFNIAAGDIELSFEHEQFMPKEREEFEVTEGQKLWVNESLKPRPAENATLTGYVFDSATNNPVVNAGVRIEWKDTEENQLMYQTNTDGSGFYNMLVAPGETYISVYSDGFNDKSLGRNDAIEDEVKWVNISLEPERIQLDISKPLNAIYLNNVRIMPYPRCILIGNVEVEVSIHDEWFRNKDEDVARVEFYLDDELQETRESAPFTWAWNEKTVGNHILKIIAYDTDGFSVRDEREVFRIG